MKRLRLGAILHFIIAIGQQVPEFLDLELPSGTLWARDVLRDEKGEALSLTFREAKEYQLPTEEQFNELISFAGSRIRPCSSFTYQLVIRLFNGEDVEYPRGLSVWVDSQEDGKHEAEYCSIQSSQCFFSTFVGDKHHVLLVKKK